MPIKLYEKYCILRAVIILIFSSFGDQLKSAFFVR